MTERMAELLCGFLQGWMDGCIEDGIEAFNDEMGTAISMAEGEEAWKQFLYANTDHSELGNDEYCQ